MRNEQFIEDIVTAVLERLQSKTGAQSTKKVLLLYGQEAFATNNGSAVRHVPRSIPGVEFTNLSADDVDHHQPALQSELKTFNGIVICPCTQNTLVEVALGLTSSPFGKIAADALWQDIPLGMVLQPPLSHLLNASERVNSYGIRFRTYIEQLRDFGIRFVTWSQYCAGQLPLSFSEEKTNEQASPQDASRLLWLTVDDIKDRNVQNAGLLRITNRTKLTPLARDMLRDMKVNIEICHEETAL